MPAHARVVQFFAQASAGRLVGEQGVKFGYIAYAHQGIAAEFAVVYGQVAVAGVGHHGLHHAHFFVVEIEQRAVGFDTGSAEDGVIHFELVDEIDGGHAGDAAVHRPHHA